MSSLLSSPISLHLPNYYYVRSLRFFCPVFLNWSFMDHLPYASPTENIFNLLESLRSESLLRRHTAEVVFDMLNVVIKWLEVSFRQLDTPQTNNPICFRDLVPRDKATCTIASRVNFFKFISNKNLRPAHRLVNCSSVPLQVVCKNSSFDFEQSF